MDNLSSILFHVNLFDGLTVDDIDSLFKEHPYRIFSYTKGELILQSGSNLNDLMILLVGKVGAEMHSYGGKVLKIEEMQAPQIIASAFLFNKKSILPVNVNAITNCKILYVSKSVFKSMMHKSDVLLDNFVGDISSRAHFLSEKIKFMSFNTIKQKLTYFLLEKCDVENEWFTTGLSQTSMSELFGVARASLARCISEMEEEGCIKCKASKFNLLNISKMRKVLSEK